MAKNRHHRLPRSKGGNRKWVNGHNNIIKVPEHQHYAYHVLFENHGIDEICRILNRWIDPRYEVFYRQRKRGSRAKRNSQSM